MRRLLVTTAAALTIARLAARLLHMPARPPIAVPIAWDRTETPVDLVKWEQHSDEALALCDPAGDLIDNDVAFVMAVVQHGFVSTLADIDELPEVSA